MVKKQSANPGVLPHTTTSLQLTVQNTTTHSKIGTCWVIQSALLISNSILQVSSFSPPGGSPMGPLESARHASWQVVQELWRRASGAARQEATQKAQQAIIFATLDTPPDHNADLSPGDSGLLNFKPLQGFKNLMDGSMKGSMKGAKIELVAPPGDSSSVDVVFNPEDRKPPHERSGVSLAFLKALIEFHKIGLVSRTFNVCDDVVKPATVKRQCCYIDLIATHPSRVEGWLGTPTFFLSHWWGYSFVEVVAIVEAHEAQRAREGLPPAYYFFDVSDAVDTHAHASTVSSHGQPYPHPPISMPIHADFRA